MFNYLFSRLTVLVAGISISAATFTTLASAESGQNQWTHVGPLLSGDV